MNFVTPLAIGGIWIALFLWQLGSRPLLPLGDPGLAEVLEAAGTDESSESKAEAAAMSDQHSRRWATKRPTPRSARSSGSPFSWRDDGHVCADLVVGLYKYLDQREARREGRHGIRWPQASRGRSRRRRGCRPIRSTTSRSCGSEENKVLDHYAWVDQNAGVVRIPIERAIDVLAEKGLPYRPAAPEEPVGAHRADAARRAA